MRQKKHKGVNILVNTAVAIALRVIIYSLLLVVIVKGAQTSYNFGHEIFYVSSVDEEPGRDVRIRIPSGSSAEDVAELLEDEGLIKNKASFYVQARFFQYEITPGTYTLNTSMTPRQMLEIIDTGPEAEESSKEGLRIMEGRRLS
jgi:cell division protein YceG involved in septum cleavage